MRSPFIALMLHEMANQHGEVVIEVVVEGQLGGDGSDVRTRTHFVLHVVARGQGG